MPNNILSGGGPFDFPGNNIGILIIHGGGGGTCADLKPLAVDLHKNGGYTIRLPLLPGFGTTPEDLKNAKIADWKAALEQEISELRKKTQKIFVGGHSMGGILTLILASNIEFDGIFTISSPVGIKNFAAKLAPFFNIFIKYHATDWEKFEKETEGKWVGYKKIPLNIVSKINILMKEMKSNLSQIKCPALIMQGRKDSVIKADSIDYIFEKLKGDKKRKVWLENNDHPILLCPDHDKIVSEIIEFIENFS